MADEGNDPIKSDSTEVDIRDNSAVDEIDVLEEPITKQPQLSTSTDPNIRQIYEKRESEVLNPELFRKDQYSSQSARGTTQGPSRSGEVRTVVSFVDPTKPGRSDKHGGKQGMPRSRNFIYMVIPPDGGYGWLILFVSFLVLAVVDGMIFTVGLLLPAIANDLKLNATDAAFIASTQMAPLGSAFINKFGFRPVAFYGGLLASLAVACSSFSRSLFTLVLFYGVIAGCSMGMLLVTSVLIIHYYFERLRPIASSVASTGSGVGLIAISLMNVRVIESMGWRYTIRIHVLLLLAVTLLTCAYIEVEASKIGEFEYIAGEDSEDSLSSVEIAIENYSVYSLPKPEPGPTDDDTLQGASSSFIAKSTQRLCCCCKRSRTDKREKHYVINGDPLDRQDIFYSGPPDYSRTETKEWKPVQVIPGEEKAQTIGYTLSVMRPPGRRWSADTLNWLPPKVRMAIRTLFDFKLVVLTEFKLLLLCAVIFPMGVNIPFVYSTSRAEIPRQMANLLPAIIGTVNVAVRLLLGLCAYKTSIDPSYLSGFGLCLGGSVVLMSAFFGASSVPFQIAFAALFGVALASYGGLRSVIYVKVLGLEKLTNAFGLTTAGMGLGSFVGTYLSGMMLDHFHSYQPAFILSGVCIIVAGIILLIIPKYMAYLLALKQRKKKVRFASKKKWSDLCSLCF